MRQIIIIFSFLVCRYSIIAKINETTINAIFKKPIMSEPVLTSQGKGLNTKKVSCLTFDAMPVLSFGLI